MRTMLKSKTNKSSLKKKKQRNLHVSLRKGFKKNTLKITDKDLTTNNSIRKFVNLLLANGFVIANNDITHIPENKIIDHETKLTKNK